MEESTNGKKGNAMKRYIDENGNPWNGCYIIVDEQTIVNPTEDILLANGYVEVTERDPTPEEEFEKCKLEKIAEINAYDKSDSVNVFYIYEQPMWLNFDERSRILTSISAYRKMGRTEMTKIYGDYEFTFSLDKWEEMIAAVEIYASECLNITELHKRQVRSAINNNELEAIDITEGYPKKLEFEPNGLDASESILEGGE